MNQLSIVMPFYWNPGLPERLARSMEVLLFAAWYEELKVEVIIVDWNPLPGKECNAQKFSSPNFTSRLIRVSAEAHSTCSGHDQMPLLEYVAKNVGIRRSRYDMVLSTNADIILSQEMIKCLSSLATDDRYFYRADRTDLSFEIPADANPKEILLLAKEAANRTVPADAGAAGDFTLMSKANWFELRGYPEFVGSDTIDTYLVELAKSRGMRQVNLPHPIYHQPHQLNRRGWPHLPFNQNLVGVRNGNAWGLEVFNLEEIIL